MVNKEGPMCLKPHVTKAPPTMFNCAAGVMTWYHLCLRSYHGSYRHAPLWRICRIQLGVLTVVNEVIFGMRQGRCERPQVALTLIRILDFLEVTNSRHRLFLDRPHGIWHCSEKCVEGIEHTSLRGCSIVWDWERHLFVSPDNWQQ